MSTELYDLDSDIDYDDCLYSDQAESLHETGLKDDPEKQKRETEYLLKMIRNAEGDEEKLDNEIKRLQGRKAALQRSIEYRRKLLASLLTYCDQIKIQTVIGTAYFVAPRTSLVIDTEQVANWPDAIQSDTNIVSYEVKVNKSELRGRYPNAYAKLPGVEEKEGEKALAIRW